VAIAIVQSRSVESGGTSSVALAFSSNVTAGNAILVSNAGGATGTTSTVTSSPSSTFTRDATAVNGFYNYDSYSTPSAVGGATTITFNCTAGGGPTIFIYEISGLATSAIADVTVSAASSNNIGTTGTSATTTQADEFCFATCAGNADAGGTPS
jgi:hypothetical protein